MCAEVCFSLLEEEHTLRVFENRVLRTVFGSKREGITEGWRKLHNEEFYNFYFLPDIIITTK
jgi:hypothetical protein